MSEKDIDMERVKRACADLGEHFDCCQIFVQRFQHGPDDDPEAGTVNINWGSGNYFARSGQIREWIIKQNERAKEDVRKEE